jgi:uncharacterized repeat protein (TIGR01451 family)
MMNNSNGYLNYEVLIKTHENGGEKLKVSFIGNQYLKGGVKEINRKESLISKNNNTKEVRMMAVKQVKVLAFLLMLIVIPSMSFSAEKPDVSLKMTVLKETPVKDADGKTHLEWKEVKATNPGDVLRYTIEYTNKGLTEAKKVVIDNPVPAGSTYVSNSAEGKGMEITFSIDGKNFQTPPMLKYKAKKPDGTEEELSATPDMYTHIRWKMTRPAKSGESGTVSFKVRVK